nr:MAG TPA: hypothetical protein [Bacteriophage sp.]
MSQIACSFLLISSLLLSEVKFFELQAFNHHLSSLAFPSFLPCSQLSQECNPCQNLTSSELLLSASRLPVFLFHSFNSLPSCDIMFSKNVGGYYEIRAKPPKYG